jgi:hypothetical protein
MLIGAAAILAREIGREARAVVCTKNLIRYVAPSPAV